MMARAAVRLLRQLQQAPHGCVVVQGNRLSLCTSSDRRRVRGRIDAVHVQQLGQLGYLMRQGADWVLSAAGRTVDVHEMMPVRCLTPQQVHSHDGTAQLVMVHVEETPLLALAERYRRRGRGALTAAELAAGEHLRADVVRAGFHGRLTACDWQRLRGPRYAHAGGPEAAIDARQRVMSALRDLTPAARVAVTLVCVDLVTLDAAVAQAGLTRPSFHRALRDGLQQLSAYYAGLSAHMPRAKP